MAYTTTEFVANVKRTAAIPTSQNTFTTDGILSMGNDSLRSKILPIIMKAQEAYFSYNVDQSPLTADGVYDIPSRAIGGKLVSVSLINDNSRLELALLTEDELYRTDQPNWITPGFFVKRSQIQVLPVPNPGWDTLRQTILIRPGAFVQTTAAAQITGIDTGTNTLTFAGGSIPASFVTSVVFDMIQAKPHFDHLAIDQTAATITTTTMVFSSLPERLEVGDWVALANESPIIQCPVELQSILEFDTATSIIRSQGDLDKLAAFEKELDGLMKSTTNLYTPRVEKEGKKVVPNFGLLRRV